jgi:hypothetical protein
MGTIAGNWTDVTTNVPDSLVWWLADPVTSQVLGLSLAPGTFDTVSQDRQQIVPIIGRPDPVVLSDAFGLPSISFQLTFIGDSDYQAFENMRATQNVLILKGPYPTGQYYVRLGPTKNDSTNLPSLRYFNSDKVVRNVSMVCQVVSPP